MAPKPATTAERFKALLDGREWSSTRFASLLHITPSAVSRWAKGTAIPDCHHQLVIERVLGIAREEWLTDEQMSIVRSAVAAATSAQGAPG